MSKFYSKQSTEIHCRIQERVRVAQEISKARELFFALRVAFKPIKNRNWENRDVHLAIFEVVPRPCLIAKDTPHNWKKTLVAQSGVPLPQSLGPQLTLKFARSPRNQGCNRDHPQNSFDIWPVRSAKVYLQYLTADLVKEVNNTTGKSGNTKQPSRYVVVVVLGAFLEKLQWHRHTMNAHWISRCILPRSPPAWMPHAANLFEAMCVQFGKFSTIFNGAICHVAPWCDLLFFILSREDQRKSLKEGDLRLQMSADKTCWKWWPWKLTFKQGKSNCKLQSDGRSPSLSNNLKAVWMESNAEYETDTLLVLRMILA